MGRKRKLEAIKIVTMNLFSWWKWHGSPRSFIHEPAWQNAFHPSRDEKVFHPQLAVGGFYGFHCGSFPRDWLKGRFSLSRGKCRRNHFGSDCVTTCLFALWLTFEVLIAQFDVFVNCYLLAVDFCVGCVGGWFLCCVITVLFNSQETLVDEDKWIETDQEFNFLLSRESFQVFLTLWCSNCGFTKFLNL